MKLYIELEDDRQFICEAESVHAAIAALWSRRADTCRDLDDVLPEYQIHFGRADLGVRVESFAAFWLLASTHQPTIRHVVRSMMTESGYHKFCDLLLSYH